MAAPIGVLAVNGVVHHHEGDVAARGLQGRGGDEQVPQLLAPSARAHHSDHDSRRVHAEDGASFGDVHAGPTGTEALDVDPCADQDRAVGRDPQAGQGRQFCWVLD